MWLWVFIIISSLMIRALEHVKRWRASAVPHPHMLWEMLVQSEKVVMKFLISNDIDAIEGLDKLLS